MLTTVLNSLTTLTSRYFVIGAYVPTLLFGFVNAALLYKEFNWFQGWARGISGTARAVDLATALIALAIVAYVLSTLNGFLRQVLEGARLRPNGRLCRALKARQSARRQGLREQYYEARNMASDIADGKPAWQKRLADAAQIGKKTQQNTYDGETGPAAEALARLRLLRAESQPPDLDALLKTVAAFESTLSVNDLSYPPTGETRLARDRLTLLKLFDFAREEWEAREIALANELQARFGAAAVAPTALGNVAESMQSYALTRYRINLATFWARLQPILQKEEKSYAVLQDAKLQLDFLVACIWLAALTTLVWLVVLPFSRNVGWLIPAVAAAGPLTTWLFYRAAVESSVGFAEVVRTSVDLHRLDLLQALHIGRPTGLREERRVSDELQGLVSCGKEWVDVTYVREADEKK